MIYRARNNQNEVEDFTTHAEALDFANTGEVDNQSDPGVWGIPGEGEDPCPTCGEGVPCTHVLYR